LPTYLKDAPDWQEVLRIERLELRNRAVRTRERVAELRTVLFRGFLWLEEGCEA
jgi:hypothetical protein